MHESYKVTGQYWIVQEDKRVFAALTVIVSMMNPMSWIGLRPHESMKRNVTQYPGISPAMERIVAAKLKVNICEATISPIQLKMSLETKDLDGKLDRASSEIVLALYSSSRTAHD
jgi:hypothetical protein